MKHAREDYSRIQDPYGEIPEDEPVFLIRAQDAASVGAVLAWASFAEAAGAKKEIIDAAVKQVAAMRKWQREHKVKVPDMP